jgi:DNA-binding SARP family transcriptional activator
VRIGILGTLDVCDETAQPIEVRGRRLRTLLMRLAVDAGRPIAAERLIDDLWPEGSPAGGANALQALVSRLRGVTGRDVIESGPGGYRLMVDPGHIDAGEFERLVGAGRVALAGGDALQGEKLLRQALGLWRGPALAEVADADFATATIARLEELRLSATEDRIDADFTLGQGARLVPELEGLVARHPPCARCPTPDCAPSGPSPSSARRGR